jgi:hypothetical protein
MTSDHCDGKMRIAGIGLWIIKLIDCEDLGSRDQHKAKPRYFNVPAFNSRGNVPDYGTHVSGTSHRYEIQSHSLLSFL